MTQDLENNKMKDHYERSIREKYQNDYEFRRWFLSARLRLDYYMTRTSLYFHLKNIYFQTCIEIGPGAGTWTKLLYRKNPQAKFDLIDISEEMRNQFRLEMRSKGNVNYLVSDFLDYHTENRYDFFFGSRVLEYVENKDAVLKKVNDLLKSGGKGMLVAKNPSYGLRPNRDNRWQHSGQMTPDMLKTQLIKHGFKDVKIYPVIIRTPILDRFYLAISEKIYHRVFTKPMNKKILRLSESYLIIFSKDS